MLRRGEIGIHPPGALGVGFYIHTGAECFIGRGGDGITQPLKEAGRLTIQEGSRLRSVSLKDRIFANFLEADALNHMPELLFICCNPDQLGLLTGELTRYLENLAQRNRLQSVEDIRNQVPIFLVLPNGILSEQTLQSYEDQLTESMLLQRLPGVTPSLKTALLERLIRGISLQAGGRRGTGKDTIYLLERKGSLVFAGGGEFEQDRVENILTVHDYSFKHPRGVPGTRIEFDKAMISVVLNVGGLIHTVTPEGDLIDLRMGDICKDSTKAEFLQCVTRAVFDVGLAVRAYPPDSSFDQTWETHRTTIMSFAGHMTSSLKTFRDALSEGHSQIKLFSNEEWILSPLIRYAANAGLKKEEALFKSLKHDVQSAMARAIRYRDQQANGHGSGATKMNLTAQRNISVELFEGEADQLLAIGTMLDNDHLIKFEMNIYLPDEQITKSRLCMIRVPFPVCREVEKIAERLIGLRIERGVVGEINSRVGGSVGCSHIKEIATNMIYFVASYLAQRRLGVEPMSTEFSQKPAEERFSLTKDLLRDSCLAYCQTTAIGLDEHIGIKRINEIHKHPIPLGEYEPSLGILLKNRTERFGDKVYIRTRFDDRERSYSWNEFSDTVFQIARQLIDRGIGAGDRIAFISENRTELYMMEMAVISIGAITVPIFSGYLPKQVAYVLGHAKPKWVVVSGQHQLDKIERDRHPWTKEYFCMDFESNCASWGAKDFSELTTECEISIEQLDRRISSVQPEDICVIMYTSGTTGPPKGVKLCHRNLISQQKAISLIWDVNEKDVMLSYLPWHHSFGGLFERMLSLYHGVEFCIDDSFGRNIDRMVENWIVFNPTLFYSVPRVHDLIMTTCREDKHVNEIVFNGRLRSVFTAGAPLPASVAQMYRNHDIPVLEGWGLTETSPCVTLTSLDHTWKSGYVGLPIPGVTLCINNDQEILVKGPNVMEGYLDDEETTSHVIDPDGWFHSGDLGEFTKEGLRIFGRKDGAYKLTTGEKVHPQRIENILVNESPYISQALAMGSGKNFVAALIYPDHSRLREWADHHHIANDSILDCPEIRELFNQELNRINPFIEVKYQRIMRAILVDRQPTLANGELTPSGKIIRKAVIDHHKDLIAQLFAEKESPNLIVVKHPQLQRTT